MSLQVWLPLDNNLKNQGLTSTIFNSSNVTYSQGKIGYCVNSGTITGTVSDLSSTSGFTIGLWMKIPTGKSGHIIKVPINTGVKDSHLNVYKMDYNAIKLHESSNTPQMLWSYIASEGGKWSYDKWFHYVTTVKNSDIGIEVKVYIDGKEAQKYTSADYNFTLIPGQITLEGGILKNDFRIYDHCLSPKEIEEWSKGLFLHYPLRDSRIEGTTNYLPYPTPGSAFTSTGWDNSKHPDAISVGGGWGYGPNTGVENTTQGYHAYWKMIEDEPTIVYNNLNSEIGKKGRWLGISVGGTTNLITAIGAGKKYTISFEAKSSVNGMTIQTGLYYAKSGTTSRSFHDGKKDIKTTTEWKKYSYTWTLGTDVNSSVTPSFYFYGYTGIEGTAYIRRMQLEVKDHATDFTIGTRAASMVEDCSGFEHHGTISGTLVTLADSARHSASLYQIDGRTNFISSPNMVFPTDQITMCCWVKGNVAGYSNYHIPLSFNSSAYEMSLQGNTGLFRGGFHVNGTRQCETSSSGATIDGNWHFIAITYDGSVIRKYVDSVEVQAKTAAGSLSGGVGQLKVGNYNGTQYGNKELSTSDVRIYATALTKADLEDLYHIGATIDNNGTLYGYEFTESGENSIFKTGIVDFDEIIEYNINRFKYHDGELWVQILYHNNRGGTVLFPKEKADHYTATDLYSRLYLIEQLRDSDGKFEFMALQPDSEPGKIYRWKQTNNPNETTTGAGFQNISNMSGALVKCSGCTHWAISNSTGNWWNAVGCYTAYNGGIPGFGSKVPTGRLEIYVKVDKRSSILKNSISSYNLYEF